MDIIKLNNNNTSFLEKFLNKEHPCEFRYYNKRNIKIIDNHKLTILGLIDNEPICYGHLDEEDNNCWLGLCVLHNYQGKGYGKKILKFLIDYIDNNNIENVKLSVDVSNYKAINLYLKNNFEIINVKNSYYIMNYKVKNVIKLPVSLGEAIDKLTILDIKRKNIENTNDKEYVEKEYNILYNQLQNYITENKFYYNILFDINKTIWDDQDTFRYSKDDKIKNKLCMKIIDYNDRRFRVKKKINNLYNSIIKEQKGYKYKECLVISHLGLGDHICMVGSIRFLSTIFDEVTVVGLNKNKINLKDLYSDDPNIKLLLVDSSKEINPKRGLPIKEFIKILGEKKLFICGSEMFHTQHHPMTNSLPLCFYKDFNIDISYFWKYFYIPKKEESNILYDFIKNKKYIFIHNVSSQGKYFDVDNLLLKMNINKDNYLIINPDINYYKKHEENYKLAELFIYKPILHYIKTIENADYIFCVDSSMFCLALQLQIKTNECYYIVRKGSVIINYNHLFDSKNGFDKSKKKIFHELIL